jgi:Restriction endonuclease
VEGGVAGRDVLLRREIAVMPPEQFEQLVFELAHREDQAVRRLVHPDGGADTLRPVSNERAAEVWQAKRYSDAINWKECEDSLDSAIGRWKPSKVTFVFPRDLSQQLERSFETRLLKREDAQKAGVEVGLWSLSELVRRLNQHPDLKTRFFGKGQEDLLAGVERAIRSGGQLESGADLVDRAKTLSEYAEQQDKDFTYAITSTAPTTPGPNWDELPYLVMEVGGERSKVNVATWVREGAAIDLPSFFFTDDEAGQEARMEAVRALARGEVAEVSQGARIQLHAPQAMRDLVPDPSALAGGTVTLYPGDPVNIELEVETAEGRLERSVDMRPVGPRPGATVAFAGYSGGVLVEVNFTLLETPSVSANISFYPNFGPDARENAEAAELLYGLYSHEHMTLRSRTFFPEAGELTGRYEELRQSAELERMEWMRRFYADLALIQESLGIELPIPDEMTVEDINSVGTAAAVLQTGEGTGSFEEAEGFVQNPLEIPHLPEDFRKRGSVRRMVRYRIFGREVELGEADYELPPLKIVNVVPWGQTPNAPARVVLAAEDDGQMRFRLVDWQGEE